MAATFAQLLQLQEMRAVLIEAEELDMDEKQERERRKLLAMIADIADGGADVSGRESDALITRALEFITRLAGAT